LIDNNIAIKVSNLTKIYHLYDKPQDRLKEALNPFKKSYHHDFYAMNDVSFEIKKGETVNINHESPEKQFYSTFYTQAQYHLKKIDL